MLRSHRVFLEFDTALAQTTQPPIAERLFPIYVETLNRCLALKTRMHLLFDRRDVRVTQLLDADGRFISQPQTLHVYPDQHDYRVCFYTSESQPHQHATLTVDTNGDGVLCLVNFGPLIDPAINWIGFWEIIRILLHEIGHTRGVAGEGGESYNGTDISDTSGDEPDASVNVMRGQGGYWNTRMARYMSPMCSIITPGHPLFPQCDSLEWCIQNNAFSDHEAAILNGWYRGRNPAPPMLDPNNIRVITSHPARVRVWSAPRDFYSGVFELVYESFDLTEATIPWHTQGWNRINAVVKVVAAGFQPVAHWISLFDLQEAAMRGEPEPFTVRINLVPVIQRPAWWAAWQAVSAHHARLLAMWRRGR